MPLPTLHRIASSTPIYASAPLVSLLPYLWLYVLAHPAPLAAALAALANFDVGSLQFPPRLYFSAHFVILVRASAALQSSTFLLRHYLALLWLFSRIWRFWNY